MRALLLAGVVAASLAGCSKTSGETEPVRSAPSSANVSVSLPEGWVGKLDVDQSFMAGPPGRPVLRIDYRKGAGDSLPQIDALRREFQAGSKRSVNELEREETKDLRLLVLGLGTPDGGTSPILLGARRSGEDLFLCATLPGAREQDIVRARDACAGLAIVSAP